MLSMTTTSVCIAAILLCATGFASSKVCWSSTWINNNHPNETSTGNDIEHRPSTADLNKLCPQGLQTLAAQCKDNKGEPFHGIHNQTCGHGDYFTVACDGQNGLRCTPHGAQCTCPDFSIQYGCDCKTTLAAGPTASPQPTSATFSTQQPGASTSALGQGGNDASVTSANLWIHVAFFLVPFMF